MKKTKKTSPLKGRRTWTIKPITKIKPSKKVYDRKKSKEGSFEIWRKLDKMFGPMFSEK